MIVPSAQSEKIVVQIMEMKEELELLVFLNSLTNRKVLKCSQELDILIYQMHLLNREMLMEEVYQYLDSKENY